MLLQLGPYGSPTLMHGHTEVELTAPGSVEGIVKYR